MLGKKGTADVTSLCAILYNLELDYLRTMDFVVLRAYRSVE